MKERAEKENVQGRKKGRSQRQKVVNKERKDKKVTEDKDRRKKRREGERTEAEKLHLDNRVGNKISKY